MYIRIYFLTTCIICTCLDTYLYVFVYTCRYMYVLILHCKNSWHLGPQRASVLPGLGRPLRRKTTPGSRRIHGCDASRSSGRSGMKDAQSNTSAHVRLHFGPSICTRIPAGGFYSAEPTWFKVVGAQNSARTSLNRNARSLCLCDLLGPLPTADSLRSDGFGLSAVTVLLV